MQRELEIATELARHAGAAIRRHYEAGVDVQYKGARGDDPFTVADEEANRIIVEGLLRAFPDDGILAEESPAESRRLSCRRLWCVDPLDGTREFIAHNGQFVVMIGLAVEGAARLGVVYQPTEDALYWGVDGEAVAQVGDTLRALGVSAVRDARNATLVVSRSHRSKTVSAVAQTLGIVTEHPLGSVGLKAVQVASQLADIYMSVSNRTHEWDACAPEAIVRAAGGSMTDVLGRPLAYNKPTTETPYGMLATNGVLHPACVAALTPVARERGWCTA